VLVTHFADGNMSWFDTERPHIVILCIIKHKLQKYYFSNSKLTNLYIRIFTFKHRKISRMPEVNKHNQMAEMELSKNR